MKLIRLGEGLNFTANNLATRLAEHDELVLTRTEVMDLFVTPEEQACLMKVKHRLHADRDYRSLDLQLDETRRIQLQPREVTSTETLKDGILVDTAPPALVERITAWWELRNDRGHLAGAFEKYCNNLVRYCNTASQMFAMWPNANCLFSRCSYMTTAQRIEATTSKPRDLAPVPRRYHALREAATQAAVLIEMLEITVATSRSNSRSNTYWTTLGEPRRIREYRYGPTAESVEVTPL